MFPTQGWGWVSSSQAGGSALLFLAFFWDFDTHSPSLHSKPVGRTEQPRVRQRLSQGGDHRGRWGQQTSLGLPGARGPYTPFLCLSCPPPPGPPAPGSGQPGRETGVWPPPGYHNPPPAWQGLRNRRAGGCQGLRCPCIPHPASLLWKQQLKLPSGRSSP